MAGATVPVGYLWVKREQKRTEEMSNLLGSNHLQLRLEEFRGKAILFSWSVELGQHPSLRPGKKHLSVLHKLNFRG